MTWREEYRHGLADVAAALNRIADAMENRCTCGGRGRPCYSCSTAGTDREIRTQ